MSHERGNLNVCDVPLVAGPQSVCLESPEYAESLAAYNEAIRLDRGNVNAYVALAWLLATHPDERLRDGNRAVRLARKALALGPGPAHPALRETLAAAYAEAGDFEAAVYWRTESLTSAC